jgi:4-carboxymuconolactone decarboxylase
MSERYEKGAEVFEQVIGSAPPAEGPDFLKVTVENLFADVWARDGLSVRDRRMLTITVLATMCKRDSLEGHVRQALVSRDLSFAELQEVAIHLAHYAGWPVGQLVFDVAIRTAMELKAARKKSET